MTQSVLTFSEELIAICSNHLAEKCYAGSIPDKVLNKIQKKFDIAPDEHLLAFYDYTTFGYGREGVAIGKNGLYWRESGSTTFISWSELMEIHDINANKMSITFNDEYSFLIVSFPISRESLVQLMTNLRDCARKWLNSSVSNDKFATLETKTEQTFTEDLIDINSGHQDVKGYVGTDTIHHYDGLTLEEAIEKVCGRYKRKKVYIKTIPEGILKHLYNRFKMPNNANIIAYLDSTIFGNGREGAVLTTEGIYWKAFTNDYISWLSLNSPESITASDLYLYPLPGKELALPGSPLTPSEWIELLKSIYQLPQLAAYREEAAEKMNVELGDDPFITLRKTISSLLQSYNSDRIYKEPLPSDIKKRLCSHFRLPLDLTIWAYFDFSHSKRGKDGVLFTEIGMYWANWQNIFIPWYRLPELKISFDQVKDKLFLSDDMNFSTVSSPIQKGDWVQLLTSIQKHPKIEELYTQQINRLEDKNYVFEDEQFDKIFIQSIAWNNGFFNKLTDYSFSENTEERARLSYRLKETEHLIAYHRGDTKAKGELGILLTSKAIHIANSVDSGLIPRVNIPFDNIRTAELSITGDMLYDDNQEIYQGDHSIELLALIRNIALYVESLKADDLPVEYPYDPTYAIKLNLPVQSMDTELWVIAIEGMLQGIYSTIELQWTLETNQLNASNVKLWKMGLSRWITIEEANLTSKL
nr:hypothetical protein [Lysinibacillus timonensis]